jgi:hypothetical protein
VSRAIDINAGKSDVMALINDPVRWKEWYPGADSLSPLFIAGQMRGFVLDSVDKGIIALDSLHSHDVATAVFSTRRMIGKSTWTSFAHGDHSTTVNWTLEFPLRWYPWEKFSSLFFDKMYGDQLQGGLDRIKLIAENRSSINHRPMRDSL